MRKKRISISKIIIFLILLVISVLALFPFIYMFLTSLQQTTSLNMDSLNLDFSKMSFVNYKRVIDNFSFFTFLKNSVIVSGCACIFNCLISAMAAYGFAKKKFPGRDKLYFVYMATLMVPGQVTLIPVFMIINKLHLMNTYPALFLTIINAFGVFLITQFMDTVPNDILEAASIDGSGEIRKFISIVIPLIKQVLIALIIFTFITSWNDFLWPLVVVTDANMQTLTLALSILKGNYVTNYGLLMAGSMMTFLPPFLLYVFLQKQFVEGIALSGVKG